jgi:hypothetical protein
MLNCSDRQSEGGKLAASKRLAGALACGAAACSWLEAGAALSTPETAASTIRHMHAVRTNIMVFMDTQKLPGIDMHVLMNCGNRVTQAAACMKA